MITFFKQFFCFHKYKIFCWGTELDKFGEPMGSYISGICSQCQKYKCIKYDEKLNVNIVKRLIKIHRWTFDEEPVEEKP